MINYAGTNDKDKEIREELDKAGVEIIQHEFFRRARGEVKTSIRGQLYGWGFERFWTYWVADGPGIPPAYANKLHEAHGKSVRVNGHCGCPSPSEQFGNFAVGSYRVYTLAGLDALAYTIIAVALGEDPDTIEYV